MLDLSRNEELEGYLPREIPLMCAKIVHGTQILGTPKPDEALVVLESDDMTECDNP